jgi:hypothetical protein
MRFCFGKFVAIFAGAAVMLFCSCEKHRVGEMPEVQKEHVDLARPSEEKAAEPAERSTSPTPPAKPTPAEFFPAKPR